jgi:hypothetical protein
MAKAPSGTRRGTKSVKPRGKRRGNKSLIKWLGGRRVRQGSVASGRFRFKKALVRLG